MKGLFVRLFLRDNYPVADPPTMQKQLNYAHAINRWQKFQIRLLSVAVLFAFEPVLDHLKTWLWHLAFDTGK